MHQSKNVICGRWILSPNTLNLSRLGDVFERRRLLYDNLAIVASDVNDPKVTLKFSRQGFKNWRMISITCNVVRTSTLTELWMRP